MLLVLVICFGTIESQAQYKCDNINSIQVLSPILKIVTDKISSGITYSEQTGDQPEVSYLDSGIFLLEENLKVCRDLLIQINDSTTCINEMKVTESKSEIKKEMDSNTSNSIQFPVKKKRKSIWNFPGNKKSSI
ncbi:hypothetical protein DLK05_08500 [Ancylomarina longa]|uniref:Uncharacterized protein n=2 Tax=Ancylomarina longa TaxID=2487017 RepID=A0A434AVF8_9BACT|nr:hypothetical protein DLK05_08500 [Ancylomarina longa]